MQGKALLGETERKGYERKLAEWESEGYEVGRLAAVLRASPQDAAGAFETAEKGIVRLRELAHELESLPAGDAGEHLPKLRKMLREPWMSAEAENLFMEMQMRAEGRRKEEARRKREQERRLARLRERVHEWKAQGYLTSGLEKLLEKDPDAAAREVALFADALPRLKAAEEELSGLDAREHEAERSRIREMLREPARAQEAEEAIIHLRVKMEKDRRSGQLHAEQARRRRAELRQKVERWRASGLKIPLTDDFLESAEPEVLRTRVEEMEESVARLEELREELEGMELEGLITEKEAIRALLNDPAQIHAAGERMLRLQFAAQRAAKEKDRRQEESRRWRRELESRIKEWKGAGYDTSRLDEAFGKDDETLKKEWGMFRIQLKHIQELESELMALPSEGIEQEVGVLVAKLRKVSLESIAEVESSIQTIKARAEAQKEAELRAREAEKREKQELVAKVMKWVEEGYRDGREGKIEKLVSKGLPAMREEVRELEGRITRMETLRKELMALDITGFETEAAAAIEELHDLSRVSLMEETVGDLKERIGAKRDEERRRIEEEHQRRIEFRSKVKGWRKLGFNVSALEENLDGDIEFLRKEYSITRMRIQKAQELIAELTAMPQEDFGPDIEQARQALYSLDRIPEGEEAVEKLRVGVAERARQRKKLEEIRKKMEDWREQGYEVSRLERLMGQDVETVTKEFLMFKIRLQKLHELEEELRSLDTGGFESERSAIERNLRNIDKLGEIRDRLSELELNIGKRMAEEVRVQEERRKLQGEYLAKMSAWLEEGFYVDQLESALGKPSAEMAADFKRFEESVMAIRQIRERLEELSSSGYEELIARIREKLRDVSRMDEARRDIHELWERIERRKKEIEGRRKEEDDLRLNIVKQIEAWEGMGYDVRSLEKRAGGRMEDLRRAMINFRMKIERMQGLHGILEAMDTRGFETEADQIRARMKEIERGEEVESEINALKEKIQAKKDAERASRERLRQRRDACTDRFLALVAQGYNVDSLDGVLELPYESLSMECERVEGVVARLKEIETELRRRGLVAGNEALLAKLKDIHALPELDEMLGSGKAPGELKAPLERIHVIAYGHAASKEAVHLKSMPETRKPEVRAPQRAPAPERPAEEAAPAPAPAPAAPELKCDACGEPIEPGWKKCPSCLKSLEPSQEEPAQATRPAEPAPEKLPDAVMDRIPARPERDLGIRDEATVERKGGRRAGKPLDLDKLVQVRNMIEKWKGQGYAVGELETYLDSGVVTKEGIRMRLEAINARIKNAAAPSGKPRDPKETEAKEKEAKGPVARGEGPGAGEPEGKEPVAAEPGAGEAEGREPVAVEPGAGEPEGKEPVAAEPGAREPEGKEPVAAEPGAGEPERREPVAAEPGAGEPEKNEPEAMEPAAGEQGPGAGELEKKEPEPKEEAESGALPSAADGAAPPNGVKKFKKVKKVVK
jgi:hypothetical protein